jgi:hypothetical protein
MFESKIIRKIYGPVAENNIWRTGHNGEDIVRFIKSQRIRWLGHIERVKDNTVPYRTIKGRLCSKRRKGRPRLRWLDDVQSDLKKKVRGWNEKMRNEEEWRLVLGEAKAHPGL